MRIKEFMEKTNELGVSRDVYEMAKGCLSIRLHSLKDNEEWLAMVPHKMIGDLAVTYHFRMEQEGEKIPNIIIDNAMLEKFGISLEQLDREAREHAARNCPAKIVRLSEAMKELSGLDLPFENFEMVDMWVATTEDFLYGACVVIYPGVLDRIAEMAGGDLFVIPSSVHEMIVIRDDGSIKPEDIVQSIRDINQALVSNGEVLSDTCYHYSVAEKAFETVEEYAERKKEA